MSFYLEKDEVERLIYKFHRTIYYFEKHESKEYGYNWQELYLLKILNNKHTYKMKDLADILKIEKFQLTRLVLKLEQNNFLRKTYHFDDKKSVYLELTDEGIKLIEDTKNRHFQLLKNTFKDIDSNQLAIISKFIDSIDTFLKVEE